MTPCTPESDANAPRGESLGGGNAFLEAQFYPPGFAPHADGISCDNVHWCAALTATDLICAPDKSCNENCPEPQNFAFVQRDGVPTGPPSPQQSTLATFTQDAQTLLMNPGDQLRIHTFNAPVPRERGQNALEMVIDDLTTGQSGFMQASAVNGFQTSSFSDCSGIPFNYQPEFNTAKRGNVSPWTALQTNISTQYEIGHLRGLHVAG